MALVKVQEKRKGKERGRMGNGKKDKREKKRIEKREKRR